MQAHQPGQQDHTHASVCKPEAAQLRAWARGAEGTALRPLRVWSHAVGLLMGFTRSVEHGQANQSGMQRMADLQACICSLDPMRLLVKGS